MKGQHQAVTAVMITGILISIAGSVYFWGIPLVQKSRDVNVLENAESLMFLVDQKIKTVAAAGGRENIKMFDQGSLRFAGGKLFYMLSTDGSIYASDAAIPLGSTRDCDNSKAGVFETEDSSVLCVTSTQLADYKYDSIYSLSYRTLDSGTRAYKIELVGDPAVGGPDSYLIIENNGVEEVMEGGKRVFVVMVKIGIQK